MTSRKTAADPTGQTNNAKRADRALDARLEKSRGEVIKLFSRIPRRTKTQKKVVNTDLKLSINELVYVYDLNADQLNLLAVEIQRILDTNLETGSIMVPEDWFFKKYIEVPWRQGSLDDLRDLSQTLTEMRKEGLIPPLGPGETSSLEPFTITTSETYRRGLAKEYVQSYASVKSLSNKTASQVFGEIERGIQAGQGPMTIRNAITKRFDVAKSDATRIARTEVYAAYNNAKLEMTTLAQEQFDITIGNMHISALTATTRETHAARHGLVYNVTDQTSWWNSGANRINCLCTTQKVVVDKQGRVINKELQEETREKGLEFFGK